MLPRRTIIGKCDGHHRRRLDQALTRSISCAEGSALEQLVADILLVLPVVALVVWVIVRARRMRL